MIHDERIKNLNHKKINNGDYVLYWMQASQRSEYNHALEYSIEYSNKLKLPLIVLFIIMEDFPKANFRHFRFMLEGIENVMNQLKSRKIKMVIRKGEALPIVNELSKNASILITDFGYLKHEISMKSNIAQQLNCSMLSVESNVIIPVEVTSNKEEYGAYTIRPKINKIIDKYLVELNSRVIMKSSIDYPIKSEDISDLNSFIDSLKIDKSINESIYKGGSVEAEKYLRDFIENKAQYYSELKNHPGMNYSSNLSPYLHFGQISPLYIALKIIKSDIKSKKDFLEELITRRELAMNYIYYNKNYDSNIEKILPSWAYDSLISHQNDAKEYIYSLEELENAKTHDEFWNKAQKEMVITGKMHGYMRMYWGKKIIEWSLTINDAFSRALYLNDRYSIDGRDANGYAGIAWCYGKHDRPWKEREIFGKIRYMNDKGLIKKFNMEKYLDLKL